MATTKVGLTRRVKIQTPTWQCEVANACLSLQDAQKTDTSLAIEVDPGALDAIEDITGSEVVVVVLVEAIAVDGPLKKFMFVASLISDDPIGLPRDQTFSDDYTNAAF